MADLSSIFNSTDQSTPGYYSPSQTALLLLDFHVLIVEKVGGPKAAAALNFAAQMRKWALSQGVHIIHGLIDIDKAPLPTCKGGERFASIVKTMKSGGAEESPELTEGASRDEVTFNRTPGFVSALQSPGMEEFLQKNGIKSLILCGLSTSGCVMRTAVRATDAEYVVTVIADGCADPVDGVHELLVEKVLNSRAYVTTAAKFQQGYIEARGDK